VSADQIGCSSGSIARPYRSGIERAADFYFDVGSPYAYLAAERIHGLIPGARWRPVLLGGLFKLAGRGSWAVGDRQRREHGMAGIERRTRKYGLPPLCWPDPWPSDYLPAMRAVTYAFSQGRGEELAMALMRAAFQRGVDHSIPENVVEIGRAAGFGDLTDAMRDPEVKLALRAATDAAHERGVFGVPTVAVGAELFWGDDRLEEASAFVVRV
jgi:2-hydroxychromene-2-carboxylate isomerase